MNYGNHFKCPVKGCKGFYSTTQHSNLQNHIRAIAKTELLKMYLLGGKPKMPHAEWLKANFKIVRKEVQVFVIDKKKFVIS